MFVYKAQDVMTVLLLYVDDIILTASDSTILILLIHHFKVEFSMNGMGALHYFLGIQVIANSEGLFLCQHKYAMELLAKVDVQNVKSVDTLVSSQQSNSLCSIPFRDPSLYRSIVGGLQYLAFTKPEIIYVVNLVCQQMHNPLDIHQQAVKRILHYIQGTLSCGLQLYKGALTNMVAYCDADWAGCPDTVQPLDTVFFWVLI